MAITVQDLADELNVSTADVKRNADGIDLRARKSTVMTAEQEAQARTAFAPQPEPTPELDVTPDPEPEPTPTPELDVTPDPEPEPTPTPELDVTPDPEPEPTPDPEPQPEPTPDAEPQPTPINLEIRSNDEPTRDPAPGHRWERRHSMADRLQGKRPLWVQVPVTVDPVEVEEEEAEETQPQSRRRGTNWIGVGVFLLVIACLVLAVIATQLNWFLEEPVQEAAESFNLESCDIVQDGDDLNISASREAEECRYGSEDDPAGEIDDPAGETDDPAGETDDPTAGENDGDNNGDVTEVTYVPRHDATGLYDEDGTLTGVFYAVGQEGATTYDVPHGMRWLVAGGNFELNGESYEASEVEINLVAGICDQEDGCKLVVDPDANGHVGVTITTDAYQAMIRNAEEQAEAAPNCGGSGCDPDGIKTDYAEVESEPDVAVTIIGSVPDDATVILNGEGHVFELNDPDTVSVSVPEGGDTYLACQDVCVIDGVEHDAAIYHISGNESDGETPQDLNETIVVSSDDNVVVVFAYRQAGGSAELEQLIESLETAYEIEVEELDLFR